ncbi:MAG TPA: hypothetical protein VHP14_03190 [Anaerolineales bacterium]|nr:hypothetical protein [Anaerolineales bacterium]
MNEKEKKDFYIATCKCCLLAEAMKACAVCRFNIGLVEQVKPVESIPLPIPIPVAVFAVSE